MIPIEKIVLGASLMYSAFGVYSQNSSANFKPLQKINGAKPRNVIFILTDDHRYDFMGFTGKVSFLVRCPDLFKGGKVISKMIRMKCTT